MMKKEIWMSIKDESAPASSNSSGINYEHYCYPLCEKKFKNGEVTRQILPCGHAFHEKCIKIWLHRGEN